MEGNISEERIYRIVRKAVEEVMSEKLLEIRLSLIPEVDDAEMRQIEKDLGDPEKLSGEDYVKIDPRSVDL